MLIATRQNRMYNHLESETYILYNKQKELLDTFLEHHAISEEQYDISLTGLKEKMGIGEQTEINYGNE